MGLVAVAVAKAVAEVVANAVADYLYLPQYNQIFKSGLITPVLIVI